MPLRVEILDLSVPEEDRKWEHIKTVNPGETLAFDSVKTEQGVLGEDRWTGAVAMRAVCAPDDSHSFVDEIARNSSGLIADTWDLMFNPPTPITVRRLTFGDSFVVTGRISLVDSLKDLEVMGDIAPKSMIKLTHVANLTPE